MSTPVKIDADAAAAERDPIDHRLHAAVARLTGGLSPVSLAEAWQDWSLHLATLPGRCLALSRAAGEEAWLALATPPQVETAIDPRFRADAWRQWPFSAYASAFQGCERWWRNATTNIPGVRQPNERVVAFMARQMLDMVSPSNFVATNPQVLTRAFTTGGLSLVRGAANYAHDLAALSHGLPPLEFKVGRDVAVTPGEVVLRTPLAEVIQYRPTTDKVHPEPIVIVPAWIMKYYILDLTPADSLVRALVAEGFTVFMVSWKNPDAGDRDRGFEDYRKLGALAAIDAACRITGSDKVHAVGYCLGGTLSMITAAAMARDEDERIASLTLLAAQADFTEAGELSLFISEAQVALLEDLMWDRGYLLPEQMAGTFQVLRANDLIWSRLIHEYLMGEPLKVQPLDAWSQDATRLPFMMESQNLRGLYLDNDLAEGRFLADGRPIALRDIRAPMFVLGTETDHIAPWRSVYKLLLLCESDITFALADHGHNVGVVAPPAGPPRHHRVRRQGSKDAYLAPDSWFGQTPAEPGSWWTVWFDWLHARGGALVAPPKLGCPAGEFAPLEPAPGQYVLQR